MARCGTVRNLMSVRRKRCGRLLPHVTVAAGHEDDGCNSRAHCESDRGECSSILQHGACMSQ
jgi:hypothetical protein